ncbi:hypothetical protein [Campylobacter sp. RM16187]|uniref:hypothetical protein n=1 Tax=Campylobacter sp. RM16187 TaxID=1660063 RepID=UPI0021B5F477|nr:hypothetical protein [Campylobacter sp. RM16187]
MFQIFQGRIYIVSETELKEQINELTAQLLKNSEILQEKKDLLEINDKLKTTNNQLAQENSNLLNQDSLINEQKQKIEKLESIIKTNEEEFGSTDEIREKFKQIDVLTKEKNEIEGEGAATRLRLKFLNSEVEQKDEKIVKLQEKIKPLEEKAIQADNLERELVVYKDRNLELSKQNKKLENEKKDLNQIIVSQSKEISALRYFKTKIINFFSSIIKKIPIVKDYLQNELPEVVSEVHTKMTTNSQYEISL